MKLYLPIALMLAALAIAGPANNAEAGKGDHCHHHDKFKDKERTACVHRCHRRFCHDGKHGHDHDGHDGHDGKDGHDGHDGHDGKDGYDGHDGHDGKDGKGHDYDDDDK
ncbi:FIK kinase [Aspergillus terreus]|uniref:FIK kinase n=1 Tax=Aspergillus terreus TaxID=33178 RepID=A0A5M3YLK3_ASPTE|nr:hypothetical protein ATETN484_0001041700 [Aspergillus terreus]GFF12273.1 FIK kinase [Aspergillus terreus]